MASSATAADLPAIKLSAKNAVPECATAGRLMSFLERRNGNIDAKFRSIAGHYARIGSELKLRWDTAFFQMLLETGNLKFGGDVSPSQNNFAGLGATGGGAPGETFPNVETGVKAHLQHLMMYSGDRVENPVAERTRNVQEWGVLTQWQQTIKGPMTFAVLAKKWAPTSRGYARDIEGISQDFYTRECNQADPYPDLMTADAGNTTKSGAVKKPPTTEELARRSIDSGLTTPAGLGANGLVAARETSDVKAAAFTEDTPVAPYTVINGVQPDAQTEAQTPAAVSPVTETATETPVEPEKSGGNLLFAAAGPAAVQAKPAPVAKCSVYTASYGGERAIVIKVAGGAQTNYTVLDVNAGSEKREAEAYIAAYAQGGELVGNYTSHDKALESAFQFCPE